MVGVEVRDKYSFQLVELEPQLEDAVLGAFAAVYEEVGAFVVQPLRRMVAPM